MKFRIFLASVGTLLAIIFLLPVVAFGIFNTGNLMGLLIAAVFLCYGVFFVRINRFVYGFHKKLYGKIILYFLCFAVVCALVFTGIVTKRMIDAADNAPSVETTVIILGCRVKEEGPSLSLLQRLQAAEKFLKENPDLKCVLSGGQGSDEPMSEAKAMYNYLTSHGIDPGRLYPEEKSTSTWENLRFSKELIEKEGLCPRVTIITNDFHQYRAQRIAKSYSMECYGISGESHPLLLPCYYLRELGGILVEDLGIL